MAENSRILLADDEEDFLKYTATLLEKEGFECDCAADGAMAVAMLRDYRYDAVISDIRMPGNADLKLAREVDRLQRGVPVILVTGYPSMDTAVRAVELPVVAYVEKPVEFDELLFKVKNAIMATHGKTDGCQPGRCRKVEKLQQVLCETAAELESTRSAFKSRRLGRLRTRLEAIVRQVKSEAN